MKEKDAILILGMVGIMILILAIFGPMQVAAAYEHNWSWAYKPEPHNWTALEPISPQHNWPFMLYEGERHNWSAVVEYKPHNWSNVLHKVEDEHDWSGVLHEPEQHNWSALEGGHEPHDWSWMLPEAGETFNPNAGWWGIGGG